MNLAMVGPTHGHRELVADLPAECTKLGKAQVVRIRGGAAADEAGLLSDELEVLLVPDALGLGEGQHALVDGRSRLGPAGFAAAPLWPARTICLRWVGASGRLRCRGRIGAWRHPDVGQRG